jgi:hypothetical protein
MNLIDTIIGAILTIVGAILGVCISEFVHRRRRSERQRIFTRQLLDLSTTLESCLKTAKAMTEPMTQEEQALGENCIKIKLSLYEPAISLEGLIDYFIQLSLSESSYLLPEQKREYLHQLFDILARLRDDWIKRHSLQAEHPDLASGRIQRIRNALDEAIKAIQEFKKDFEASED